LERENMKKEEHGKDDRGGHQESATCPEETYMSADKLITQGGTEGPTGHR
jgi:hypothetical protein